MITTSECATRGEDMEGKKDFQDSQTRCQKMKTELKQNIEGKGRLEDEDKMLKRLNLGDDPARRTEGRRNAPRIPPSPLRYLDCQSFSEL